MLVRTEKTDKKGRRIYVNKFTGEKSVLPYVRNAHKKNMLPSEAMHYLTPAPSQFERLTNNLKF